jgi:pimeloyl-ACP methyl ester carboxylesterase
MATEAIPAIVHDDDMIVIAHLPGTSGIGIVSFTGVDLEYGGMTPQEFQKCFTDSEHDIWFVTDKTRHWYNETYDAILRLLQVEINRRNITRAVTLGNSMGGFGAILFAKHIPNCTRAIAFAPQSAIAPGVVAWETRWRDSIVDVTEWRSLDAAKELDPWISYYIFVGAAARRDIKHASRLRSSDITVHRVEGARHNVARFLKQNASLSPLINDLVNSETVDFPALRERRNL